MFGVFLFYRQLKNLKAGTQNSEFLNFFKMQPPELAVSQKDFTFTFNLTRWS